MPDISERKFKFQSQYHTDTHAKLLSSSTKQVRSASRSVPDISKKVIEFLS